MSGHGGGNVAPRIASCFWAPPLLGASASALGSCDLTPETIARANGDPPDSVTDFSVGEMGTYTVFADCTSEITINFPPMGACGAIVKGEVRATATRGAQFMRPSIPRDRPGREPAKDTRWPRPRGKCNCARARSARARANRLSAVETKGSL